MSDFILPALLHSEPETWTSYARQLGGLDLSKLDGLPDFLIIAPAKTGTTWLSQNLSCHSEIYVPQVKEVKFFSTYWRWLDINWYLDQFCSATQLKKGEATPSYALLPSHRIKLIKALLPNLRLIFLMRDPVERAWSQAKHSYKYQEANFRSGDDDDQDLDRKFINNFTHPWSLAFGDYLGALQRWLAFFSKEQMYVGFYETIKNNPKQVLTEVFNHLGVAQDVEWTTFHLHEKILPGIEYDIKPEFEFHLRSLYRGRTQELSSFLLQEFHLTLPSEWMNTLESNSATTPPILGERLFMVDDQSLVNTLQEEVFVSNPRLVEKGYKGFNLVLYLGRVYALSVALGPLDLTRVDETALANHRAHGQCFVGDTLHDVKQAIAQRGQLAAPPFATAAEPDGVRP